MTSRTVNIEATKRRLHARLSEEFGDVQRAPEVTPADSEKPFIHVEFDERRPSYILPILHVVTEYGKGISTVSHNLKRRRP